MFQGESTTSGSQDMEDLQLVELRAVLEGEEVLRK